MRKPRFAHRQEVLYGSDGTAQVASAKDASMDLSPTPLPTERRQHARRRPRTSVQVACRRGSAAQCPDLALALVELSRLGARLLLRESVEPEETVSLHIFEADRHLLICRGAIVRWSVDRDDGATIAGVEFFEPLAPDEFASLT
jgi:hypothetical protein